MREALLSNQDLPFLVLSKNLLFKLFAFPSLSLCCKAELYFYMGRALTRITLKLYFWKPRFTLYFYRGRLDSAPLQSPLEHQELPHTARKRLGILNQL